MPNRRGVESGAAKHRAQRWRRAGLKMRVRSVRSDIVSWSLGSLRDCGWVGGWLVLELEGSAAWGCFCTTLSERSAEFECCGLEVEEVFDCSVTLSGGFSVTYWAVSELERLMV